MRSPEAQAPRSAAAPAGRAARWILLGLVIGLLVTALDPAASLDDPDAALPVWMPETVQRWEGPIRRAALAEGLSPTLIAIQMLIESGGNPHALSPVGAVGLMQVMPATGAEIAGALGLSGHDLWAPETNIQLGAWYLARQREAFGAPGLVSAAYNGGPGVVLAWQAGASLPDESARARHYVDGMWRERWLQHSPVYEDWLARYGAGLVAAARETELR
ncbi:MAG: lytic transglycosylase domain-containing protein [Caldilineae bacterium]|nr:lytic transglycosylase domain-containing protein [Caldilineae bacterium]